MTCILPGGLGQISTAHGVTPAVQTFTSAQVDPAVNNVFSFSMASAAGNSGLVLLGFGYPATSIDESTNLTCKWAAQTMTRIGGYYDPNGGMNVFAFGVVSPTSGTQSVQITGMSNFLNATSAGVNVGFLAVAFTGSNTSSVANAFKNWTAPTVGTTAKTTFSFSITSAANNLVVGYMDTGSTSPLSFSSGSGTVMSNIDLTTTSGYNFPFVDTYQTGAPSSTVSFTWSKATSGYGMAALSVSP